MKIYSWNVNGIRSVYKKGALQAFIKDHQPDILCLQETKANHDQIEVDFEEYEEYWCSAKRKGYSGTAIFTKHTPLEVYCGLPEHIEKQFFLKDVYGDTNEEGRVIVLEFEGYFVTSVYTPNAKDDLSRLPMREAWDKAFLTYILELQKSKPVIFGGDLNVAHTELDLARPKENKGKKGFTTEERTGFDHIVESGFVDTLRLFEKDNGHYTWWSHFANARARNVGWRIDYFLISNDLVPLVKYARIHAEVMGSDHCPVSIELAV
ncbi:MAG: exodeoxyribonuclease III [Candidatus Nomurabacteria bacterium]|nr:exodeoxyribonuclease III [Candidatus Nomurabacteria bacterium]USN87433.1 MAG: exodeoxyribonuclease III [Candidatus Nomurabacteria bacterium]